MCVEGGGGGGEEEGGGRCILLSHLGNIISESKQQQQYLDYQSTVYQIDKFKFAIFKRSKYCKKKKNLPVDLSIFIAQ